ncbi:MAG: putative transcriptional regulator [Clostridiales bacterium]|jgi:DNA-binding transcriptional regulator YhcF (GntR family)|nr:putative transcriptional regulator [Clostridiales bacterium]
MLVNFEDEKPIYVQLSEGIEDAIISGAFPEETQIPSTTEISINYKINPATALKGINLLVDNEVIYKKRGVGMFVSSGAVEKLVEKRQVAFFENFIKNMVDEAKKLNISKTDIVKMIERGYGE